MSFTSYAQNFEDVMLWRALGHIEQGLYIDIGAQDPIIDSVSLAFHEHGWKGIHVEPIAQYAELLRQHRPADTVIQAAVGQESAVLPFYEIPKSGISTADAAIAAQHRERGFNVQETTVPCIPLAAIFKTCAEQEIHWLKIDVEGFEQQVLSSWGTSAARPWIVLLESTLPLTQIETHQSWESIIIGHGYTSAYFDGLNRYYVSDAHPELKAAFASPPNVFDGFALNGTASAPFHQLIAARYQEKIAEVEQEKAALTLKHSEQANALQHQYAEREQTLHQKLQALQEKLERLQQERVAHEKLLHDQNSQSRQELESLLRQLVQREQELLSKLLQCQQRAQQDINSLSSRIVQLLTEKNQRDVDWQQDFLHQEMKWKKDFLTLHVFLDEERKKARDAGLASQRELLKLGEALRLTTERERRVSNELSSIQQIADLREREFSERSLSEARSKAVIEEKYDIVVKQLVSEHEQQQALRNECSAQKMRFLQLATELESIKTSSAWRFVNWFRLKRVLFVDTGFRKGFVQNTLYSDYISETEPHPSSDINSFSYETRTMSKEISIADLLELNDISFVWKAYQTILRREPDRDGMEFYLTKIREGVDKESIIADIAMSKEASAVSPVVSDLYSLVYSHKQRKHWFFRWLFEKKSIEKTLNRLENSTARNQEKLEKRLESIEGAMQDVLRRIDQIQRIVHEKPVEYGMDDNVQVKAGDARRLSSVLDLIQFAQPEDPVIVINDLQMAVRESDEAAIFASSK